MTGEPANRSMDYVADILRETAGDFAAAIPAVDEAALHDRWAPGIGPFEEENQVDMILGELAADGDRPDHFQTQVPYPESAKRCDLVIGNDGLEVPVEVKLLRFRRDNGNIDPNMYKSVFSPFPESGSSSLLTDARKLAESGFLLPCGLLGLYYEREDEEYEQLRAGKIAEKFELDVKYWYDLSVKTVAVETFDGLRHPHHQHGAVIAWVLSR